MDIANRKTKFCPLENIPDVIITRRQIDMIILKKSLPALSSSFVKYARSNPRG